MGSQNAQSSTISVHFFTKTASKVKEEAPPPPAEAEAWALKAEKAVLKGVHCHTTESIRLSLTSDSPRPLGSGSEGSPHILRGAPQEEQARPPAGRSPRRPVSPEEDRRQSTAFTGHVGQHAPAQTGREEALCHRRGQGPHPVRPGEGGRHMFDGLSTMMLGMVPTSGSSAPSPAG